MADKIMSVVVAVIVEPYESTTVCYSLQAVKYDFEKYKVR